MVDPSFLTFRVDRLSLPSCRGGGLCTPVSSPAFTIDRSSVWPCPSCVSCLSVDTPSVFVEMCGSV